MASRTAPDAGNRVVIENVTPSVDGGRFNAKRCAGDRVVVEADIFVDGHDALRCLLLHRRRGDARWLEVPMAPLGNDRWQAAFDLSEVSVHEYVITAWTDAFLSWRHDAARWTDPQDVRAALDAGALLVGAAANRARGADARALRGWKTELDAEGDPRVTRDDALHDDLLALMLRNPDRSQAVTSAPVLGITVDPPRAGFSTWYELFPRSTGNGQAHGTFKDVEALLPEIAAMGFDVLYFPPIHPIGITKRKGRNNALVVATGDPGSPWAIGGADGGHKAIHHALGTSADFRRLVQAARAHGIDVALDIAFQTSPDHPYVTEHPAWFRRRPDGSVQYAENPPKKYEDIYPFDFDTHDWKALWQELKSVFLHWIAEGVTIFRVDNPHTKPFPMWEWILGEIKRAHPQTIFLAEAFTRPRPMHRLAKIGFSQSYTYFTWRTSKAELTAYFTELTRLPASDYFRPNAWPNTPDILHAYLQSGLRAAFEARLVLAATLCANYGIYGPAFELMEHVPRDKGSEEYADSEKYTLKAWARHRADSLRPLVTRVNAARRDNPALQRDTRLVFHRIDNAELICYSKSTHDLANVVLVVVNLDPRNPQSGWTELSLADLGIDDGASFDVHDLLTGARYRWRGTRNYVELRPQENAAHVFRVQRASQAAARR